MGLELAEPNVLGSDASEKDIKERTNHAPGLVQHTLGEFGQMPEYSQRPPYLRPTS